MLSLWSKRTAKLECLSHLFSNRCEGSWVNEVSFLPLACLHVHINAFRLLFCYKVLPSFVVFHNFRIFSQKDNMFALPEPATLKVKVMRMFLEASFQFCLALLAASVLINVRVSKLQTGRPPALLAGMQYKFAH